MSDDPGRDGDAPGRATSGPGELERLEARLRASEEKYRRLFENVQDVFYQTDPSGRIVEISPSITHHSGYGRDELLDRDVGELYDRPGDRRRLVRALREHDRVTDLVVRLRHKHGRVVFTSVNAHVVRGPGGENLGVEGSLRDVTQRREAEARLAEALEVQRRANAELDRLNRLKSDFVSIVSHEFRTALTGILGFSEMMRDEGFSLEEMKEYAGDINNDAQRLGRMIDELLDLDRLESGRLTLNLETLDLVGLVRDVVDRFRPGAPGHTLRIEADEPLPRLTGDRDKLVQVFTNLLSNAVKYSPDGGDVAVAVRLERDHVHATVSDRGIGIPPDRLESVFDRYRRSERAERSRIGGTGLGLPIVRQIIELHGGRVWAESAPGEGATFHAVLPLVAAPRPAVAS